MAAVQPAPDGDRCCDVGRAARDPAGSGARSDRATVGHTAAARVYWLCGVLGEPGAETTPFTDPNGRRVGGRPRPSAKRRGARGGPRHDVGDHRSLPRPLDARDARGDCRAGLRGPASGPLARQSCNGSPRTRPTTAASCHRPSGSPVCPRSISGARTEPTASTPASGGAVCLSSLGGGVRSSLYSV